MAEKNYIPELTVFLDMDGVLAGFESEAIRRVKEIKPEFIGDLPRSNFYLADDYPEYSEVIRSVCAEPGFFDALPVLPGAKEGWQRLLEEGWQPRILSSPLRSNPTSESDKRKWLKREFDSEFGPHVSKDAIITKHKHEHDGVALLDDRGVIPHADQASWKHIVMHYPHNEAIDTDLRLSGMDDPRLEEMVVIAHQRYMRALGSRAI
jgi:5'-nucleotidase